MRQFKNNMRVQVAAPDNANIPLLGKYGTVVRLLKRDHSAWIRMDEEIPIELQRCFPEDDSRRTHINLFPEECVKAEGAPNA